MAAIFISHAVADARLAELLTDFLKEAIGVPHSEIFCSSVAGHGVPVTVDFNNYMKQQIRHPELVFLLMTPSYMESTFCLMELGAAWAQSHRTLPIIVPPVSFSEVTKTLGLVQALNINKSSAVIDVRKAVQGTKIVLEKRDDHVWEKKKTEWVRVSKRVVGKLPPATKILAAAHKEVLDTVEEQKSEIIRLRNLVDDNGHLIEKLKATKDKANVTAILEEAQKTNEPEVIFNELVADVTRALPNVARVVKMHIIMDHYGKASKIDWFSDRDVFEDAIQRNVINNDDENSVAWNKKSMPNLRKALRKLDKFLESDEGEAFINSRPTGDLIEADDRDFWDQYV